MDLLLPAARCSLLRRLTPAFLLIGSLTVLSAQTKEYVRLGGRVIAVVSPDITVTIQSPSRTVIGPSETAQFVATVAGLTDQSVTWTVESGSGGIAGGLYTALGTISDGTEPQTVTVKATSDADSSKSATATLTVRPVLDHASRTFTAASASDSIFVTKSGQWTITGKPDWIDMDTSSRQDNAWVAYTVHACAAPDCTANRSATLTIAGRSFLVQQNVNSVAVSISPASRTVVSDGATGLTVNVQDPSNIGWSATKSADWIAITAPVPPSGTGSGTVTYSVASNVLNPNPRSGSVTIAGVVHTVNQVAGPPRLDTSSLPASLPTAAATYTVQVIAPTGAAWTASCNSGCQGWVTFTPSASGTGTATLRFDVSSNTGVPRQGTVTVTGSAFSLSFDVFQLGNIRVLPSEVVLAPGTTQAFHSYLSGTDDTSLATWTVSPNVGSFTSPGVYAAPSSVTTQQTVTVTATRAGIGSASATVTLVPWSSTTSYYLSPTAATPSPGAYQWFTFEMDGSTYYAGYPAEFLFSTGPDAYANSCGVRWYVTYSMIGLLNNDGSTLSALRQAGMAGSGTLSNTQCTVDVAASYQTVSGDQQQIVLHLGVRFNPSFAGTKNVYMSVQTQMGEVRLDSNLMGTVVVPGYQPPSVAIDQPSAGATVAGAVTINGWALDNTAQVENSITAVEVYLDGVQPANKLGNATYGSSRSDICTSYPGRPGCPNVGFSYVWDSSGVSPGLHTIRVIATDNDAGGGKHTEASASVTVGRAVTIATSPAGLPVTVDGTPYTAPQTFAWAVGSTHAIAAANQQVGDVLYTFQSWSDGGSATHTVTTPSAAQTITATFTAPVPPLDQYVTNVTLTSGTTSYLARNSVVAETAVTISGSASVVFKAGNYILLKPGFQATAGTAGTTFHASIDPSLQ